MGRCECIGHNWPFHQIYPSNSYHFANSLGHGLGLVGWFFTHYSFPTSILSDQGCNFESNLIKELCDLGGICKICATPYHPQRNEQCEWFNSILISMIGTVQDKDNATGGISSSSWLMLTTAQKQCIWIQPILLNVWRKPKLGLNLQFGLQMEEQLHRAHHDYVSWLEDKLHWTYNLAQKMQEWEAKCHKWGYDCKIWCTQLQPGDHILLWWKCF